MIKFVKFFSNSWIKLKLKVFTGGNNGMRRASVTDKNIYAENYPYNFYHLFIHLFNKLLLNTFYI